MKEKEKGATQSNTPNDNTGAKVQNIQDTHKDMSIVLDYFRCICCIYPHFLGYIQPIVHNLLIPNNKE